MMITVDVEDEEDMSGVVGQVKEELQNIKLKLLDDAELREKNIKA